MSNEIGAIPKGWASQQLDSLCDGKDAIVDGPFGSNLKRSDYRSHGIPVLKIQNVKPNQIELKKMDFVSEEKFAGLSRHSFLQNDILMTKLGDPLGVSAIVKDIERGLIVADLVRIRPQRINTYFLCYQLNSPRMSEAINSAQKGTTRPRINLGIVRNLPIVFPSADEQQRIVEILEEQFARLDAALASVRKVRDKAKSFRRSLLHFALTPNNLGDEWAEWASVSLADIASILNGDRGKNYPSKAFRTATGVPFVNAGHLVGGSIEMNKMDFIGADHFDRLGGGKFVPDDVLFCIRGSIGKVALNNDILNGAIASSLVVARAKNNVIPRFLFAYLSSPIAQKMAKQYNNGTAQPNLAAGDLKKFEVSLPTVDVQRGIVDFLDYQTTRLDAVLLIANELEVRIDSQRRSLLHAAFSGTLTAQWRESQSD